MKEPAPPTCLLCGKEMTAAYDEIAKKVTRYLWECPCMPKGLKVCVG